MEGEANDLDDFLLNSTMLYESEPSSLSTSVSSDAVLSGSDHPASQDNLTNNDPDIANDTFDWLGIAPGNGWTPQSMSMSMSMSVSSSQGSSASISSAGGSSSRRRRVTGSPDSLAIPNLEAAVGARCSCVTNALGQNCMGHFDIGDVFRLRHARSKMTPSEALEQRYNDLNLALQTAGNSPTHCRLQIRGHSICLQAYCMLYDFNLASMRRTWRRFSAGIHGQHSMGRPRGSSGGVMSTARGMQAYAWLLTWIEVSGDQDPVGHPYKYIINFVLPAELYEEYHRDFTSNQIGLAETALSGRAFARVFAHFRRQEKVRVRRKANTTTKCQSILSLSPPTPVPAPLLPSVPSPPLSSCLLLAPLSLSLFPRPTPVPSLLSNFPENLLVP